MKKTLLASAIAAATFSGSALAMENAAELAARMDSMPEVYGYIQLVVAHEDREDLGNGITTGNTTETVNKLGVMELFVELMDSMLNSVDGTVTRADDVFDSRIELIEDRIEQFDQRLEARRLQLQREFAAMESALAQLQGQQSALVSLQNAVLSASVSGLGLN